MAIEIVDFPINSMVIFHSYVKLPEGTSFPKNFQDTFSHHPQFPRHLISDIAESNLK